MKNRQDSMSPDLRAKYEKNLDFPFPLNGHLYNPYGKSTIYYILEVSFLDLWSHNYRIIEPYFRV